MEMHLHPLSFGLVQYVREGVGVPLLFLHDRGGTLRTFASLISQLPDTLTKVALDFPGHGGSAPQDPYPDLVELLAEFVVILELDPVNLIGLGSGADIALQLADRYPELATRIILLHPEAYYGPLTEHHSDPEINAKIQTDRKRLLGSKIPSFDAKAFPLFTKVPTLLIQGQSEKPSKEPLPSSWTKATIQGSNLLPYENVPELAKTITYFLLEF